MEDAAAPGLEAVRLSLRPGDKVVVTFDGQCSCEMYERTRETLEKFFGDTPVLLMTDGARLTVIGPE